MADLNEENRPLTLGELVSLPTGTPRLIGSLSMEFRSKADRYYKKANEALERALELERAARMLAKEDT